MKKNVLSIAVVAFFLVLALASRTNKIHYGAFNYQNHVEDLKEKRNYLVANDGSRIYGEKISWKSGLLSKDQIQVDGQKYKISEIIGYRDGNSYYGRLKNGYIKRIVRGKLNVYVNFTQVSTSSTNASGSMSMSSYTRTDHYAQKGDTAPLENFAGQSDIKKLVSDCPLAVEMASLSNSKMRKAIRKDPNYLNSIFETYNNNCKAKF